MLYVLHIHRWVAVSIECMYIRQISVILLDFPILTFCAPVKYAYAKKNDNGDESIGQKLWNCIKNV